MRTGTDFYVYELIDPRDGEVFYVGKGCGRRVQFHVRDAKRGGLANPYKAARICDILAAGFEVVERKTLEGLTETQAFQEERRRIRLIGISNLTNIAHGNKTAPDIAAEMVRRIKPFDQWASERPRSDRDRELFHQVAKGLAELAELPG